MATDSTVQVNHINVDTILQLGCAKLLLWEDPPPPYFDFSAAVLDD